MKRLVITALAVACALGLLAGCSAIPKTQQSPKPTPASALDQSGIDRIMTDLGAVLTQADQARDANKLKDRVYGPALVMRTAQYKVHSAVAVTPLPTKAQVSTVTSALTWPREVIVVTADTKDKYVLVLRQENAGVQYRLYNWVRLLPKMTLPQTFNVAHGSPSCAVDAKEYLLSPTQALATTAAMIFNNKATNAQMINDPNVAPSAAKILTDLQAKISGSGSAAASAAVTTDKLDCIALSDGSALVFGTINITYSVAKTGGTNTLSLGGAPGVLLGDGGAVAAKASWVTTTSLALVLPPSASKNKINVVGAQQVVTSASKGD